MKFPQIRIKSGIDWSLVVVPVILVACSMATLYSITSLTGNSSLVIHQIEYFVMGIVLYILMTVLDYRDLKNYVWYFYIIGLVLLILVGFLGAEIFGSKRWIELGFFQFQPSELMKVFLLIFSASYFANLENLKLQRVLVFLVLAIIPVFLILIEPDLGTALTIVAMVVVVLLSSGLPRKFLLFGIIGVLLLSPVVWLNLKPYQKERVVSFINPSTDLLGSGYNVSQAKIAVGSGGLFGKGFSGATQSQLRFLPVAQVDFIFSSWAEATGFAGSIIIVFAFGILISRIFIISLSSKDRFGMIFASGAAAILLFQAFVNIGMNIGIMPVTGIPLPFISAGGTSFLINAALLGVVQSIYLRRKALKFE